MTAIANVTPIRPLQSSDSTVAAAAPVGRVKLRLTRRGRIVFSTLGVALVVAILALVAMLAAPGAIASNEAGADEFPRVLVESGDSLWAIAESLDPAADTRDVVAEIVRLNQLRSSELQAGEVIAVPMRFAEHDRAVVDVVESVAEVAV